MERMVWEVRSGNEEWGWVVVMGAHSGVVNCERLVLCVGKWRGGGRGLGGVMVLVTYACNHWGTAFSQFYYNLVSDSLLVPLGWVLCGVLGSCYESGSGGCIEP